MSEDDSRLDVLYVLLLLQAAMGLLSGGAMLLFMGGSPLALPVAVLVPVAIFAAAAGVVRRRRWALRTALVAQYVTLLGLAASFLLGLLAVLDFSINLMTLLTNVALPLTLIRLLRTQPKAAEATGAMAPAAAEAA
jgi:hypothetical protein